MEQNTVYDFSLFEPKRKQEVPGRVRKKPQIKVLPQLKQKQVSVAEVIKIVAGGIVALSAVFLIVAGNVRFAELSTKADSMQTQLNDAKSEYVELQVNLESRMSLDKVEDYAVNTLGLTKIQNYQITYINVNNGDKVEVSGQSQNFILKYLNKFVNLVKSYFA